MKDLSEILLPETRIQNTNGSISMPVHTEILGEQILSLLSEDRNIDR